MIKYLLFDLDGTILDTNEIIMQAFEHTLKFHLDYDLPRDEIIKIFGEPLIKQMQYFHPELADDMCKTYRAYYDQHSLKLTQPFQQVKEVVKQLKLLNIPMGIITNKYRQPAIKALKEFELWPYFQFIIGGDELENSKPHPEPVLKGMEYLNATPAETLMIGDSPLDLEAARHAGIKAALVDWNIFPSERFAQIQPDYRLSTMTDLFQILQIDVA